MFARHLCLAKNFVRYAPAWLSSALACTLATTKFDAATASNLGVFHKVPSSHRRACSGWMWTQSQCIHYISIFKFLKGSVHTGPWSVLSVKLNWIQDFPVLLTFSFKAYKHVLILKKGFQSVQSVQHVQSFQSESVPLGPWLLCQQPSTEGGSPLTFKWWNKVGLIPDPPSSNVDLR